MQKIAERLNCQEVQYNDNTAMWTKHMIHRILVCEKYCSGEKLPVLITTDIFQRACILRMRKTEYHARSCLRYERMQFVHAVRTRCISEQAVNGGNARTVV